MSKNSPTNHLLVKKSQLTWLKTGWFYLWLVVFSFAWYSSKASQLSEVDGEMDGNLEGYLSNDVSGYTNSFADSYADKANFYLLSAFDNANQNQPTLSKIQSIFLSRPQLDLKTAYRLKNNDYLVKSVSVIFAEISFCLLAVWIFLIIVRQALWVKLVVLLVYILSIIFAQLLFLNIDIWFSMTLVYLMMLVSAVSLFFYQKEFQLFLKQDSKIDHLLGASVITLYNERTFEPIIPMIEQVISPTQSLIEQIQEVAILAEGDNNNQLAKRLHLWIIFQQVKNTISQERLIAINVAEVKDNLDSELENTLVIDGTQENIVARPEMFNIKSFGRYQTEGILGKGAMGIVFQGVDPKINRHVAIKTLYLHDSFMPDGRLTNAEQTEHKTVVERFFREAETAGNLSHANIVTIYDVGEQEVESSTGKQMLGYIAMDLLEGSALNEYTKKKQLLPPYVVFQLMIQMADALEYAHQSNVVHRDIKPANIIFNQTINKATLTDFGIAYIADHSKTKTGTIMGSPYYMSPEQVMGKKVDGRSDIFSLGVTFYQLLTGELPFHGESIASVAFHITNTKHPSVRSHLSKLPSSSARITNKALQKDVGKRYQSMKEFKQALINALKKDYKKQPI